mmetsp:Transcript_600/g.2306  ORF Transcript_600/g.2306 Transcript_600/m.2306 type:complete len:271 (-) Transcript_600:90-902(-)
MAFEDETVCASLRAPRSSASCVSHVSRATSSSQRSSCSFFAFFNACSSCAVSREFSDSQVVVLCDCLSHDTRNSRNSQFRSSSCLTTESFSPVTCANAKLTETFSYDAVLIADSAANARTSHEWLVSFNTASASSVRILSSRSFLNSQVTLRTSTAARRSRLLGTNAETPSPPSSSSPSLRSPNETLSSKSVSIARARRSRFRKTLRVVPGVSGTSRSPGWRLITCVFVTGEYLVSDSRGVPETSLPKSRSDRRASCKSNQSVCSKFEDG